MSSKNVAICTLTVSAIFALGFGREPAEPEKLSDKVLRQRVIEAKSPSESGRAFARYFKEVGRGSPTLKFDADISIALQAAWEEHAVILPDELEAEREEGDLPARVLRPGDAQRFFGFLEGRGGVEIPEWWEGRRDFPERMPLRYDEPYDFEETDFSLYGNKEKLRMIKSSYGPKSSAVKTDDGLVLSRGEQKLTIVNDVVEQLKKDARQSAKYCIVEFSKEKSCVAIYDDLGLRFPLYCIESKTGKLLWKAEIWGQREDAQMFTGGGSHHEVQLQVEEQQVAVWGAGLYGAYVECFDPKTGTAKFRFSTEYWKD